MRFFEGGITAPNGFKASSCSSGIKASGRDIALIDSTVEANCAGLFTTNAVKAAPVLVTMEHLGASGGLARALVVNSGNANACNGEQGLKDAGRIASCFSERLGTSPERILLASTGVIGRRLPAEKILTSADRLVKGLSGDRQSSHEAALAIMTTDTVPKEVALELEIGGKKVRIAGMAKGAGMIHPNLATMLAFVTTDAGMKPRTLKNSLERAADTSFNMITVDGDMSTNDTLLAMANGRSRAPNIVSNSAEHALFTRGLARVCINLAKSLIRDAEGSNHLFEIRVKGAASPEDAKICARSISRSNLVKSAIFGQDPNWGRIMAAAGYSGAEIDQESVCIGLCSDSGEIIDWVKNGQQISEKRNQKAKDILALPSFRIEVDLGLGPHEALSWGCDLSYDYVKINSEYTT